MDEIKNGRYEFVLVNFANADLVGHSGNFDAVIKGVKTVDKCVHKIVEKAVKENYYVILTGDHGNAEELTNPRTEEPDTEHSIFPVPIWYVAPESQRQKSESEIMTGKKNVRGILGDVAPTVLSAMNLKIPPEMTGRSLLEILK